MEPVTPPITPKQLGKGAYAKVARVGDLAVKTSISAAGITNRTVQESRIMRMAKGSGAGWQIMPLLQATPTSITMPLMKGGSLFDLRTPMSVDWVIRTMKRVLLAINHVHASGVVHGDVKGMNILFEDEDLEASDVVLGDFGMSFAKSRGCAFKEITPEAFRPPEHDHGIFTERGDLWSWALCFLNTAMRLTESADAAKTFVFALGGIKNYGIWCRHRSVNRGSAWFKASLPRLDLPDGIMDLLSDCLCVNLEDRIDVADALDRLSGY